MPSCLGAAFDSPEVFHNQIARVSLLPTGIACRGSGFPKKWLRRGWGGSSGCPPRAVPAARWRCGAAGTELCLVLEVGSWRTRSGRPRPARVVTRRGPHPRAGLPGAGRLSAEPLTGRSLAGVRLGGRQSGLLPARGPGLTAQPGRGAGRLHTVQALWRPGVPSGGR